jgi:hypothetical protein
MNPVSWLREHPRVAVGGAVAVALVAGVGIGRFTLPTKVEEREVVRTVEVVKWRDREVITKGPVKVVTKTVTTPGPAGPTVTVDREVFRDKVVTVHVQGKDTVTEKDRLVEKVVERDAPRVAVFGTVGLPFSAGGIQPLQFGAAATARVLGPISVIVAGSGGASGGVATGGLGLSW